MKLNRETGGMVASLLVHLAILGPLAFWTMVSQNDDLKIAIETMFAEERPPEEFTREMSLDQQVSETLNVMEAGGAVTDADGGALKLHGGSVCAGALALVEPLVAELRAASEGMQS